MTSETKTTTCPFNIDTSPAITSNNPSTIHAAYDALRTTHPLAYTTHHGGYYLLTRYTDIKSAALNPSTFISSVRAVIPSDPRGLRRPPLNFDAPHHTPYRTALDRTLKPARLLRLAQPLEAHAESLLLPLIKQGKGDVCTEFAAQYAAWVETEWLNLTPETAPRLAGTASKWVDAWRRMDGEQVTAYSGELYEIARGVLEDRRVNPREREEDPVSSLLGEGLEEVHLLWVSFSLIPHFISSFLSFFFPFFLLVRGIY